MAVAAHSGVNYKAIDASAGIALGGALVEPYNNTEGVLTYPPIQNFAGLPPSTAGFTGAVNGLMQAVSIFWAPQFLVQPKDF